MPKTRQLSKSVVSRLQERFSTRRARQAPVMASPPTRAFMADNAVFDVPGRTFIPITDARIAVHDAEHLAYNFSATLSDGVSRDYYATQLHPTYAGTSIYTVFSFETDAPVLGLQSFQPGYFTVRIDGELTAFTPPATASVQRWVEKITNPSRQMRRYDVISHGMTPGIWVGPYDTVRAPDLTREPSSLWFMDSYGTSPPTPAPVLPLAAMLQMGLYRASNSAVGGSGYQKDNTSATPPDNDLLKRLGELTITGWTPDMIVVCNGINDTDAASMNANAVAVFAQSRQRWPETVLVATGPWCPDGANAANAGTKYPGIRDNIKNALAAVSGPWVFIDNLAGVWNNSSGASGTAGGLPWQTGTGRAITFTGALSAATSAVLTSAWAGATGSNTILFSDGTTKTATLTNGSTAVSWSGAVTATANAAAYSVAGNAAVYVSADGTHLNPAGVDYLAARLASAIQDGVLAL